MGWSGLSRFIYGLLQAGFIEVYLWFIAGTVSNIPHGMVIDQFGMVDLFEVYLWFITGTVSNIPHGMVIDQFGMVDLLRFICGLLQAQCLTSLMVW